MNTTRTIIAAVTVFAATSAFAQHRPIIVRAPGQELTKKTLHLAVEEINKGMKALGKGLPIYQGDRVDAIQFGDLAKSEIKVGLFEQRLDARVKTQSMKADVESAKRYSERQIKESNVQLTIGAHYYQNALDLLRRVDWNYDNHKNRAVVDLEKALNNIRIALNPYGGTQANMPKGGFRK